MRTSTLSFLLLASSVSLLACDSSDDPVVTPTSQFVTDDPAARALFGVVYQGTEPVGGVLVGIDPDPNLLSSANLPAMFSRTASTDPGGLYRLQLGPFQYDLSVTRDSEVFVFRHLQGRFFAPPLGADITPRGFKARIVPTVSPAPAAGHSIAYFVAGADARLLTKLDALAYEATFRNFDTLITLRAVEYDTARGLASATAEGRLDFHVVDGMSFAPNVTMTPVNNQQHVTFSAVPPPGFTLGPIVVKVDYVLRTSSEVVGVAVPGKPFPISVLTDARYSAHVVATASDGAISQSGLHFFGFGDETLELPPPLVPELPGDTFVIGSPLSVPFDKGLVEHVLTPANGAGTTVHVATDVRATTLPDVTRFGLATPSGRYTYTVEHFPDYFHPDEFSGEDGRVSPPSWKSGPRVIVIR